MSDKLSRKQVLALSRALKRKGRKLPAVGRCVILSRIKGPIDAPGRAEICHTTEGGKHVYRKSGFSTPSHRRWVESFTNPWTRRGRS